ncbi:MAG: glycosyltransferase family 87 protein [Pseudomonadota bacterium]
MSGTLLIDAAPRPAVSPAFVERAALAAFVAYLGSVFISFLIEGDVAIGDRGVLGGDFLAFYAASLGARSGEAAAMYDVTVFEAVLRGVVELPEYGLWWQYPPPVFALVAPLSFLPYPAAYAVWIGGTFALFAGALRLAGLKRRLLIVSAASPLALITITQGQIALLTGALLVLAAGCVRTRPVLAGVCAGLLIIKPQLAVLLPVAYAAAGCWRAFAAAAATVAVALAASTLAYGVDIWPPFFEAVARLNADISGPRSVAPLDNMATPMATLMSWGVPAGLARLAHGSAAIAIAAFVGWVWRRRGADDLAAATLCAGAVLVTPYAYAYELVLLGFPCAVIAARAAASGWLRGEREALALGWIAAMAYGLWAHAEGWPVAFGIALACFTLVVRRAVGRRRPSRRRPAAPQDEPSFRLKHAPNSS